MDPAAAERLLEQRKAARKAMAQGRRWYLRGVLMCVVASIALVRGGQLYYLLAGLMLFLAALSVSLWKNLRMQARAMEEKIDLMAKGAETREHGGTA